jgi:hypothetical protein
MHQKQDGTKHQHTVSSQPWWRGIGHDPISTDILRETTTSLSPSNNSSDSLETETRKFQVKDGLDEGNDVNKKLEISLVSQSGKLIMVHYCMRRVNGTMIINGLVWNHPASLSSLLHSRHIQLLAEKS